MFGSNSQNSAPASASPSAAEIARLQGGGLVHVIVSSLDPMTFALFLNERSVPQLDVASLMVEIEAPANDTESPKARATLSQYVKAVTGERSVQTNEIFPSTVEIVALGRRLVVTCQQVDSLDGLWISLGLKPDGTGSDVGGLSALRVVVTEGILDARLTWTDGSTEDLFSPVAKG